MKSRLRALARRLLGVRRTPTYYLPWLTRPGLECVLVLSNVEARFKQGHSQGPFPVTVRQYDDSGALVRRYDVTLRDSVDAAEVRLEPTPGGCGFVTVEGERIYSDLYVTLSDSDSYTATHGRGEFVERYPVWTRVAVAMVGRTLGLFGSTIPAFARDQYVYSGPDSRSHLLLMNLSNVANRLRVTTSKDSPPLGGRLVTIPPMGSRLVDVTTLLGAGGPATSVTRLRLEGNAWFNLYIVGAGTRDLSGPLSLMHVK